MRFVARQQASKDFRIRALGDELPFDCLQSSGPASAGLEGFARASDFLDERLRRRCVDCGWKSLLDGREEIAVAIVFRRERFIIFNPAV